jgi:hypothetical protein
MTKMASCNSDKHKRKNPGEKQSKTRQKRIHVFTQKLQTRKPETKLRFFTECERRVSSGKIGKDKIKTRKEAKTTSRQIKRTRHDQNKGLKS